MPTMPPRRITSSAATTCRMPIREDGSSMAVSDSSSANNNDCKAILDRPPRTRGGLLLGRTAPVQINGRRRLAARFVHNHIVDTRGEFDAGQADVVFVSRVAGEIDFTCPDQSLSVPGLDHRQRVGCTRPKAHAPVSKRIGPKYTIHDGAAQVRIGR